MEDKLLWLKRLGLCLLPLLLVELYVQAASAARLQFYFPIGLFGTVVYAWYVSTRMNKVYPQPQRAIGQLCISFLLFSLSSTNEVTTLKSKITQENVNDHIYGLSVANGKAQIASFMFVLLLISYLAIRVKHRKSMPQLEETK
jgi:hypothetical protein